MPSANVETVRRANDLFAAGRVDECAALFTEDVEVPALALVGTESIYRGREGLRRWFHELKASDTEIRQYADEFIEADERRVVVVGRVVVDRGGGRSYGSVAGWIYTLEDGCICRVEVHPHPGIALRMAGLEDETAEA